MKAFINKKTCSLWGTALMCMAAFTLIACGSDDDDEGESGNTPSGPVVTYNGNLITYNGDSYFSYDKKGRCVKITNEDEIWTIDYEKGILYEGYTDDEDLVLPMQIAFTKEGYIKKLFAEIQENVDGVNVKISGTVNIEYDSNGHVTSGTSNLTTTAKAGAATYTQYSKSSCKYTWEGDLMTKSVCDEEEAEEGEKWTSYSTCVITYGDTENKYRQWSHSFDNCSYMADYLGFVGLLGKAPSKFIQSDVEKETSTYNDGDPRTDEYTYNVTCDLNNAGIINTEKIGYQIYQYQYDSYSRSATRAVANSQRCSSRPLFLNAKELKKRIHDVATKVNKQ